MKPKYAEVRRMLLLALGCWNDFLNTLNSPLWSKCHLPDDIFLGELYNEFYRHEEIREALILVSTYWQRHKGSVLALGLIGLRFSKPHTVFEMLLCRPYSDQEECARLVSDTVGPIDKIEFPIMMKEVTHKRKEHPSAYRFSRNKRTVKAVQAYENDMLLLLTCSDPITRAGIELQLVQRGFKV